MSKRFDLAVGKVRNLPDADEDDAAEMLLWTIEMQSGADPLDEETAAAIDEGLAQVQRGEFASEADIVALWKRHSL